MITLDLRFLWIFDINRLVTVDFIDYRILSIGHAGLLCCCHSYVDFLM